MMRRLRAETYLRRIRPISNVQVSRYARTGARDALLNGIVATPAPASASRRRRWRMPVIALAAVAAIGGSSAAAAWTLSSHFVPPKETTLFDCYVKDGFIDVAGVTGNPVEDCANEWRLRTGSDPPKLVAYRTSNGRIRVMPATRKPPMNLHLTRLPAGVTENVALIKLQESLNDHVDGLSARCYDADAARTKARRIVDRLGLKGWTIAVGKSFTDVSDAVPDGRTTCALGGFDPRTKTVAIHANRPSSSKVPDQLAAKIRADSDACWNVSTAAKHVRADAAAIGLSNANGANEYQIRKVIDPSFDCTVVNENVGGTIFITLRGPAQS
jgi:hypothetical protein